MNAILDSIVPHKVQSPADRVADEIWCETAVEGTQGTFIAGDISNETKRATKLRRRCWVDCKWTANLVLRDGTSCLVSGLTLQARFHNIEGMRHLYQAIRLVQKLGTGQNLQVLKQCQPQIQQWTRSGSVKGVWCHYSLLVSTLWNCG